MKPGKPRLPQRANVYIAPDGSVHFGALFKDLVPVADALAGRNLETFAQPDAETAPLIRAFAPNDET